MSIAPVSVDLIGEVTPTEYFHEHFAQYEQEFLDAICARGYPQELWPVGERGVQRAVHMAKRTGNLPDTVLTNLDMTHDTYNGQKQNELVVADFKKSFGMLMKAFFVLTQEEEWWPYAHGFLVHNAETAMLYFLYRRATVNQDIIAPPAKRGRPKNEAAHAEKSERSKRYSEWLKACADYREELNRLQLAYENALRDYRDCKAKGSPKWIP